MAEASTYRDLGDYVMDMSYGKCLGRTPKVSVYLGEHKRTKTKVAGKMFIWQRDVPTDMVDREVENMMAIPEHDNVLKLLDYQKIIVGNFKEVWLILELCEHGHLGEFAKSNDLTLAQKVDLMLQSARGVQHLHHLHTPMIHRDLKPANLLVTGNPKDPLLKVADYGESRHFQGSHEDSMQHMTATGTPYYQAPELFSGNRPAQNKAVDVFALGVSFLDVLEAEKDVDSSPITVGDELLGPHLHENPNTDVRRLVVKPGDSDDVRLVKKLICEMLARDPRRRPLIDDVVERLHALRTAFGVKVLVAVDTVWETPTFYLDKGLMNSIDTNIPPHQSPVTTAPPKPQAAMRMEHAERVITAAKTLLDKLRALRVGNKGEDGGEILAVNMVKERGVWVHEGDEWERVSGVPEECPVDGVCMCRVEDGVVACGGGNLFVPPVSQCHHFSVLTRQWRKLRDMSAPRALVSAVEYDDMKVLVACGRDKHNKKTAACEILDVNNNTWSPAASMPEALIGPLMAAGSGRVYVVPRDWNLQKARLMAYDPSGRKGTPVWVTDKKHTYLAELPSDVRSTQGACLVVAAGKLYLLGGKQGLALEYNPQTDQWLHLTPPSLRYDCYDGCCAAVMGGRIKLCGGSTEGQEERDMVEVYDVNKRTWKTSDLRLPIQYWDILIAHFNV